MVKHLEGSSVSTPNRDASKKVDCAADPIGSLVQMFVGMVQAGRIAKGQCPALRPVFLKPHGIVHGTLRVNGDLPESLRVGIFQGKEYPAWVRFSSDTLPTFGDYTSTLGIGIKLFDVPGLKIFGDPHDTTFDIILQNNERFFVNTASDMCAFTRAGVVEGDYDSYLRKHPKTKKILDEMAKPVGSVLASPYWSCIPFSFGPHQYVKYKLEPTIIVPPPSEAPVDPTYLAADLADRLAQAEVVFRLCVQLRTDPQKMPLDLATVTWSEEASPPIHVADLVLPKQDITTRGQPAYGENLSWNVWRVTEEHTPQGSIAEARRSVYAASAALRRDVNGVPTGEPDHPKPKVPDAAPVDRVIVRAAIHPGIGVARVGDSKDEFFIGPEVTDPPAEPSGFYRDASQALKRQAARFRIYGYNAAGKVVAELTPDNAEIHWTVHLANRKAQWYRFLAALDIPDAVAMECDQRNKGTANRAGLAIDPGPRSIAGKSVSGGPEHAFDTGTFDSGKGAVVVPLGEIRTDEAGRLIVLGGHGKSGSPSDAPLYDPADGDSFNNANDWWDDTSDGPVTATVSIGGRPVPVDGSWVIVGPPNYAPNVIGWRTLYDLLTDVYVESGWLPFPKTISFSNDVLPFLQRLSNLQWVNAGFAGMFGRGRPMDFEDPALLEKLSKAPNPETHGDPYGELRRQILNSFRPSTNKVNEPRVWPWLYGDAFGSFSEASPLNGLPLPSVQQAALARWADGDFLDDWDPDAIAVRSIDAVPLADQPAMLDKAALHFCLSDAFHPGCEVTWPMRHASMYEKPYRIRHRAPGAPEPDYSDKLTQAIALAPGGPLYAQGPGDLTRWMAIPWQGDTAFCRSGYNLLYDPYLPSFWPARVPNQVLTEADYRVVMDTSAPREERLAAYNRRAFWTRTLTGSVDAQMKQMIKGFAAMGLVEERPGVEGDPDFPPVIFVESVPPEHLKEHEGRLLRRAKEAPKVPAHIARAGWESQEVFEEFYAIRVRFTR